MPDGGCPCTGYPCRSDCAMLGFEGYTFDGPHLLGVIVFAGVIAIACLGCCVFHMCCAASEGHSSVRLGGLPKKNQVAMEDPDDGQCV